MRITRVEAFPVRIPRDLFRATGTAGSPTVLMPGASDYRWSESYPALYAINIETALVCIYTDWGLTGWGEAQAPLAPQVACTIIDCLLKPILFGFEFDPTPDGIEAAWNYMYSAMRVRGQTGGFMLDAISGIDLALWDVAGRAQKLPVSRLIAGESAKSNVCSYVSGLQERATLPGSRPRNTLSPKVTVCSRFTVTVPRRKSLRHSTHFGKGLEPKSVSLWTHFGILAKKMP